MIDELLGLGACEPSVHCRQVTGPASREVRLGNLKWMREDAERWCHSFERTETAAWIFVDLQVYCPPKALLIKEDGLPAIYVQLQPLGRKDYAARRAKYDQGIHIAIDERLAREKSSSVQQLSERLLGLPGAVSLYESSSRISALNAFESALREDFVYRGILDSELPDVTKMRGKWSRVGPSGA